MALNQPTPTLRLTRRPLIHLALLLPFFLALYSFGSLQGQRPSWPEPLVDTPVRGKIVARDGTIFAEGPVNARRYPQSNLAAHLVGFSGAVQPDGRYGLEGLELTLDARLQAGEDVTVTIDPALQAVAQAELSKAARARDAENGTAVILEAGTGRILAAASYPEFDPNRQAGVRDRSILLNSAFLRQVEPGSTMKPFVVASLLADGRLNENETFEVAQTLKIGDQTFRDVAQHEPQLGVPDILRYSSNVGMIQLSERYSSQELYDALTRFGFGQDLNVPGTYTRSGQINAWRNWVPQDHASATIGQSLSVTALQLATAYSIFANDGMYIPPKLLEDAPSNAVSKRVIPQDVARTMRDLLQYTVENSGLRKAKIPGVSVAGKSGTADIFDRQAGRYIEGDYTLSFAGMFPAEAPRAVIVVYLQKPKIGDTSTVVATPIFRAIGSEAVALWGLPPQMEHYSQRPR